MPAEPLTVLAEHTADDPFAHAERLMPLARAALAEADRRPAELDAVVVGLGPGPFTGLRVGIATAAALGDGLGIPVHGVPSHDGACAGRRGHRAGRCWSSPTPAAARCTCRPTPADGGRSRGPEVLAPAARRCELDGRR